MILTLDIASEIESVLLQTAHRQGKMPEWLGTGTLRANFAQIEADPTARRLLALPEAERNRILSEAAALAAPLYEADLALPPEERELTAISAINSN